VGAGFFLTNVAALKALAEAMARAQFAASRNPDDCALMYTALGRKQTLQVG
jgi:hypothetical protein